MFGIQPPPPPAPHRFESLALPGFGILKFVRNVLAKSLRYVLYFFSHTFCKINV